MHIVFGNNKLAKRFHDIDCLLREYGQQRAKLIARRLADLRAVDNLEMMKIMPGGCHALGENLAGLLSLDLDGPYRLIIEPATEPLPLLEDGGLNWKYVTAVRIVEVRNTHGK